MDSVPVLPGAWDLLDSGIAPGGTHRNLQSVSETVIWESSLREREQLLLCDAQTSGGLLIAVPGERKNELMSELINEGVFGASEIGKVTEPSDGVIKAVR